MVHKGKQSHQRSNRDQFRNILNGFELFSLTRQCRLPIFSLIKLIPPEP